MKSLWNDKEAKKVGKNLLDLRVYSSRKLGQHEDLVLHGGGNTSVKVKEDNIFGESEEILYVKGSGWNLGTIKREGFAPVKLKRLIQMAALDRLSDMEMVKLQRTAMINPSAPNPSVEAILHAIIPFQFVDHTHADAVVTISNSPKGKDILKEIYGDSVLVLPYVMPGFILAKQIYDLTKSIKWDQITGIILMHHGVFTFHENAKESYENMVKIVSKSEDYLRKKTNFKKKGNRTSAATAIDIANIRKKVSQAWKKPVLAQYNNSKIALAFSELKNVKTISKKGPLTPDHIIRTKRNPVIIEKNASKEINQYIADYQKYFEKHSTKDHTMLDPAPRWSIMPEKGTISFGNSVKNLTIINDISEHTMLAIMSAEQLGGWQPLKSKDLFEMEYWVLEQMKLKKNKSEKPFQGKIAIVTGAAAGIGKACVEKLIENGAVVAAIDINPKLSNIFEQQEVLPLVCDVTNSVKLKQAIEKTVLHFGGIDMLVSNAGIFPKSYSIKEMDDKVWEDSLNINLNSHKQLLKFCIPYLELGIDSSVVIIGSKNVPAPGPGASAYSVAKAGLNQLTRIAAMELGAKGIRVNIIHPNAVYDTGIWTAKVLKERAKQYGLSVEEYKTNNVLKTEVTSYDVAELTTTILSKVFSKVTGAQIPIDGGNDRVI